VAGVRKVNHQSCEKEAKTTKRVKLIQRSGFEPCTRPTKPTTASWRCSNSDSREVRVEIETLSGSGSPPRQVKVPMRPLRRLGDPLLSNGSVPRLFESGMIIRSRRIIQVQISPTFHWQLFTKCLSQYFCACSLGLLIFGIKNWRKICS
jgi:hypothetical protein